MFSRMHADEVEIDEIFVRDLVSAQFPQWADLPVEAVVSAGTDNAIYRIGDGLAARLPRTMSAAARVNKEQKWLPRIAPYLPLPIPTPVAKGTPSETYPWPWSICRWVEGENVSTQSLEDSSEAARDLAAFVRAFRRIDVADGPLPGQHNSYRGVPLGMRDAAVRAAIEDLRGVIDAGEATSAWKAALRAPKWEEPPVWIHGDMIPTNLIVQNGRLTAVVDFGCMGVGDPACDLMVAWTLLEGGSRDVFRAEVQVDDGTWTRGRGWALSFGLIALPYYQGTNPVLAAIARRAITQTVADRSE